MIKKRQEKYLKRIIYINSEKSPKDFFYFYRKMKHL